MLACGIRSLSYSRYQILGKHRQISVLFAARPTAALAAPRPRPAALLPPRPLRLLCRSAARPSSSMGRTLNPQTPPRGAAGAGKAPPAAPPPPITVPTLTPPARLQKLSFAGGSVCDEGGVPILEGVTGTAFVSSAPGADFLVLGVEAAAPASSADFPLGMLRCRRWLACARNKLWWMTPEWGSAGRDLPPETQFLLMELEGGDYAIALPLIDADTFRGTIRPPRNSGPNGPSANGSDVVYLRMESGDEAVLGSRWAHALLVAAGPDPYALVDAAVPAAAALSGTAKPLREKRLPPSVDCFAWCTWDAFYSSVSAAGVLEGVRALAAGGAPPRTVIIDDGWQSTNLDARFRGWQDPGAAVLAAAREKLGGLGSLGGTVDSRGEDPGAKEFAAREQFIEGELEMISAVVRDVPAGSSTGVLLQEVKATDDANLDSIDYYTMAQQHDAVGCAPGEAAATAAAAARAHRGRGNAVFRASAAVGQYAAGLVVGAFQALVILFYQWVVDPAADGTWPVRFFAYLAAGPLRAPMLQFYADQTNFTRRLVDVRANAKFHAPDASAEAVHSGKKEDLAAVVAALRGQLGVEHIYCWHGLSAYWSGVCPDAPAMRKYRPKVVFARPPASLREIEPSMQWNPSVLGGLGAVFDPAPLFRDMHSYLAAAGVTGVKVDCQAGVGMVGSVTGGGPAVAARYHAALEDSVAAHFPANDAINCMCHSTENIYRWRDTAVARASDDFYPTDTASHLPHVAACAFNGLFLSALALPDFDMFHSRHAVAGLHAAARAVSGGPVYVSDAPGHHNFELLHQLVLPDGGVLRARLPGRPTRDCLFADVMRDGATALKIWNVNAATGVVGVFNLQGSAWCRRRRRFAVHEAAPPRLAATVRVTDVETFGLGRAGGEEREEGAAAAAATKPRSRASTPSAASEGGHWAPASAGDSAGSTGYESDVSSGGEWDGASNGNGAANGFNGNGASNGHRLRGRHRVPASPSPSGDFAAYINVGDALRRLPASGGVEVALDGGHAAVVTFARVNCAYGVDFAPLGLKNMLNGGGAVLFVEVEPDRGEREMRAVLSDSGTETESYADLVAGELAPAAPRGGGNDGGGVAAPPPLPRFTVGVRGRGVLLALCSRRPASCWVDGYEAGFRWREEAGGGGGQAGGGGGGGVVGRLEIDVPQVGDHMEQRVVVRFR